MRFLFGSVRMIAAVLAASVCVSGAAQAGATVASEGGSIVLHDAGKIVRLTQGHADRDPVLSPDGRVVVFTRAQPEDEGQDCVASVKSGAGFWSVDVASGKARQLTSARASENPKTQLCVFSEKQFSSDGKRLYFSTPAWATSGAVWVYDFTKTKASYLLPGNGFFVLSACKDKTYRDKLVVSQHRYFAFGGSYDWYWLFGPNGGADLGAVGETADAAAEACDIVLPKT